MKEIEIACPIGKEPDKDMILSAAARAMGVPVRSVSQYRILRRSVDA